MFKSLLPALVLLLLTFVAFGQNSDGPKPKPPENEHLQRLIAQLGDKSHRLRAEATQKLLELDIAHPSLFKAADSSDLEVSVRSKKILNVITRERPLQRLIAKGKKVAIDQFIDQLFQSKESVGDDCWRVGLNLAESMLEWAKEKGAKLVGPLKYDFLEYPTLLRDRLHLDRDGRPDFQLSSSHRQMASTLSGSGSLTSSFLICRDSAQFEAAAYSIVLCNGSIPANKDGRGPRFNLCIVFCDGDLVADISSTSILIATGKITIQYPCRSNVVIQNAQTRSPFFRLFEPADVGIEVKATEDGVAIHNLHKDKAFAQAGLQKGDILLQIGQKEVTSVESFRKLLRRAVVERGERLFRIRRSGQTREFSAVL